MGKIVNIKAREILDSRGNPTVETTIISSSGIQASASVPSGASKGTHEALEIRDGDTTRFNGMGVLKTIAYITGEIKDKLLNLNVDDQERIDNIMIALDGTENKTRLGANSLLSVSLSCARLAAEEQGIALYEYVASLFGRKRDHRQVVPLFNIINGGLHGTGKIDFQEFLLIPDGKKSFHTSYQIGSEIYHKLKNFLKEKGLTISVGDEGGFTPELASNKAGIEYLRETIQTSPYEYGKDVHIGLDLAASTYYQDGMYHLIDETRALTTDDYISYLVKVSSDCLLFSLEDPLFEDDWDAWVKLTQHLGKKMMIIGDDLLVTNITRLKKAVERKACNSIVVKVNQIGTLTETLNVIRYARRSDFKVVISHRSGETNDNFIADLAVGVDADFVKFGAPARGERVSKYNRLLEIYSNEYEL